MSIWIYCWSKSFPDTDSVVLFDGENTYWTDEMRPSAGYTLNKLRRGRMGKFFYIGEL